MTKKRSVNLFSATMKNNRVAPNGYRSKREVLVSLEDGYYNPKVKPNDAKPEDFKFFILLKDDFAYLTTQKGQYKLIKTRERQYSGICGDVKVYLIIRKRDAYSRIDAKLIF